MKRHECHCLISGERRRVILKSMNTLTAWVKPLSKWPQCVVMNSLQTKTIKRHLTKHHVTVKPRIRWPKCEVTL